MKVEPVRQPQRFAVGETTSSERVDPANASYAASVNLDQSARIR